MVNVFLDEIDLSSKQSNHNTPFCLAFMRTETYELRFE